MPMKDHFDPADPLPRFLAERREPHDFGNVRDGVSRLFKMSALIAAVAAIGIATLALGDPVAVIEEVTASLVRHSSPQPGTDQAAQPGTDQSTPIIQTADNAPALTRSSADTQTDNQASPPTANDVPARDEVAAAEPAAKDQTEKDQTAKDQTAKDPTAKDQTETSQPSSESEALFKRFQAWVTEQDAQAKAEPVQGAPAQVAQNDQNDPAPVEENVPASRRLTQRRRQVRAARNAQAEMRTQNPRKQVRRAQDARAERPPVQPVQDARAQDPSGQGAQSPGFLSIFGQRN